VRYFPCGLYRRVVSRSGKSSEMPSVTVEPRVNNNDARPVKKNDASPSGRQKQRIQQQQLQQMDELDRHRQSVQRMSKKIIDLHAKVCITL